MAQPPATDEEYTQETREASPAHLLTRIKSFSMISKRGIRKLESMEFEAGDCKWKVVINFDGGEHIHVNLSMVGRSSLPAGWEVNAIFNFLLYNHISDKYLCFRGKARCFHAINHECGFSKLITKSCLMEPSNGFLYKDMCVFGAEVFVIRKQPLVEKVSVLNLSTPYKREWYISKFSKLESSWSSEVFSAGGYKWEIVMFPNGCSSTSGHYVGVHLKCVDAKSLGNHKKVNAECVFCFRNRLRPREHHSMTTSVGFTSTAPSWGFDEFISIDDMRNPNEGFVVGDCCTLEIQLSIQALHEATYTEGCP